MEQIIHKCHKLPCLDPSRIDQICRSPENKQTCNIHQKEKQWLCDRHQLEQSLRISHKFYICLVKSGRLVMIIVKCPDHTDPGQIFPGNPVQRIQRRLLILRDRSGNLCHNDNPEYDQRNRRQNDQRQVQTMHGSS